MAEYSWWQVYAAQQAGVGWSSSTNTRACYSKDVVTPMNGYPGKFEPRSLLSGLFKTEAHRLRCRERLQGYLADKKLPPPPGTALGPWS